MIVAAIGNAAPLDSPKPTPTASTGDSGSRTPAVCLIAPTDASTVAQCSPDLLLDTPSSAEPLPSESQGLTIAHVNPAGWFATLPGLSSDGNVQPARHTVWRNALRDTSALSADTNHDGLVDSKDVARWQAESGVGRATMFSSMATPAPASIALLIDTNSTIAPLRSPAAR